MINVLRHLQNGTRNEGNAPLPDTRILGFFAIRSKIIITLKGKMSGVTLHYVMLLLFWCNSSQNLIISSFSPAEYVCTEWKRWVTALPGVKTGLDFAITRRHCFHIGAICPKVWSVPDIHPYNAPAKSVKYFSNHVNEKASLAVDGGQNHRHSLSRELNKRWGKNWRLYFITWQ